MKFAVCIDATTTTQEELDNFCDHLQQKRFELDHLIIINDGETRLHTPLASEVQEKFQNAIFIQYEEHMTPDDLPGLVYGYVQGLHRNDFGSVVKRHARGIIPFFCAKVAEENVYAHPILFLSKLAPSHPQSLVHIIRSNEELQSVFPREAHAGHQPRTAHHTPHDYEDLLKSFTGADMNTVLQQISKTVVGEITKKSKKKK